MLSNLAAIRFTEANRRYTLKACFDALMKHKEIKKYRLLHHALTNDLNPAIASLEKTNYDKSKEILKTSQYRAGCIVRTMLGKRLHSFFQKWRCVTSQFNSGLNTKLKDHIIKLYKARL